MVDDAGWDQTAPCVACKKSGLRAIDTRYLHVAIRVCISIYCTCTCICMLCVVCCVLCADIYIHIFIHNMQTRLCVL